LRSNSHARGVPSGKNGSQIRIEEIDIIKRLVYSVILHLLIVLRIWKLSMRSVLINFNFELMLLFTEYFKIVLERFRSSLLHYRYMDGILTVVRACLETQLDYSNYLHSIPQNFVKPLNCFSKTKLNLLFLPQNFMSPCYCIIHKLKRKREEKN
jgi:hypothetical protein